MKIRHIFFSLLCASLLHSCSSDSLPSPEPENSEHTSGVTLRIVSVSRDAVKSRAATETPVFENGDPNENLINSAVVILMETPLNDPGSGKVLKILNFPNLTSTATSGSSTAGYYASSSAADPTTVGYSNARTYQAGVSNSKSLANDLLPLSGSTVYAIALANINISETSNFTTAITEGMTVSALRDVVYKGPLYTVPTGDGKDDLAVLPSINELVRFTDFAMSAINEVKFTVAFENDHLEIPELLVQRLASRVDIAFGVQATQFAEPGTDNAIYHYVHDKTEGGDWRFDFDVLNDHYYAGTYRFAIWDENEHKKGNEVRIADTYFILTDIKLGDCATGTYLFEHSKASNNTITYLGNEGNWDDSGNNTYSTNFITSWDSRTYSDRVCSKMHEEQVSYTEDGVTHTVWKWVKDVGYRDAVGYIEPNCKLPAVKRALEFEGGDPIWGTYSILGYTGENTFSGAYSADNKYTYIELKGTIPAHLGDHFDNGASNYTLNNNGTRTVSVKLPLRHSFGPDATNADKGNNLYYGTVRNTIYRVYVKFYAHGDDLDVIWYYRDSSNGEVNYINKTTFYNYILESNGSTPND